MSVLSTAVRKFRNSCVTDGVDGSSWDWTTLPNSHFPCATTTVTENAVDRIALLRALEIGDRSTRTSVLSDLHASMGSAAVPVDLPTLWTQLGVIRDGDQTHFDDSASLAKVLQSIIGVPAAWTATLHPIEHFRASPLPESWSCIHSLDHPRPTGITSNASVLR